MAPSPSKKALQNQANQVLTEILVHVLTTPPLRKKAGVSLKGRQEVSLGLEVDFLTAPRMKTINRKHLGKNHVTDVLSFPVPDVFREQGVLGELLICTPVMLRQARELGHGWKEELAVLLTHGVLHLLG